MSNSSSDNACDQFDASSFTGSVSSSNNTGEFLQSLGLNVVIACVVILCFSRVRRSNSKFYEYNSYEHYFNLLGTAKDESRREKPKPSLGLNWISSIWNQWDAKPYEWVRFSGLDGYVMVYFIRSMLKFLVFYGTVGLIVISSLNFVLGLGLGGEKDFFDQLTISNVPRGNIYLLVHLIYVYVLNIGLVVTIQDIWREFAEVRKRYLFSLQPNVASLTVLITNIPETHRSKSSLISYFSNLFGPECIESVTFVRKSNAKIDDLCATRKKSVRQLERMIYDHQEQKDTSLDNSPRETETKPHWIANLLNRIPCVKLDSIFSEEHLSIEDRLIALKSLESVLAETQKIELLKPGPNCAFVTFSSRKISTIAAQTVLSPHSGNWITSPASLPTDVIHQNLLLPDTIASSAIRGIAINLMVFLIVFLWIIPITAISAASQLDNIVKVLPFLQPVLSSLPQFVISFLQGWLPTLALKVFISVLPSIFLKLANIAGYQSYGDIESGLFRYFHFFLIFNVLLVYAFSNSIIATLSNLFALDNEIPAGCPQFTFSLDAIITELASSLPGVATTFLNYVILETLLVYPLKLLNIGGLIISNLKLKFLTHTVREMEDVYGDIEGRSHETTAKYGVVYSYQVLVVTIALCYAVISPIILPVAALYFLMSFLVESFNLIYKYQQVFSSGGKMWPAVSEKLYIGMAISQFLMIGVFQLKDASLYSYLIIPLPFITFIMMKRTQQKYENSCTYLSLEAAVEFQDSDSEFIDNFLVTEVIELRDEAGDGESRSSNSTITTSATSSSTITRSLRRRIDNTSYQHPNLRWNNNVGSYSYKDVVAKLTVTTASDMDISSSNITAVV